MNSKDIMKCIKEIDIKLVMPLKTANLLPEYDPYLERIGEALRQLYHKVNGVKDPWKAKSLFNKNNEVVFDED